MLDKKFNNIKDYLDHWDKFFEKWKKSPEATFDEDVVWNNRKGTGKKKLEYDVFPQPYLGNYENHSIITLNLNPSRSKKYGYENFKEPDLNPEYKYEKYAKCFHTYHTHPFWKKQDDWIDRIFEKLGKEKPSKEPEPPLLPFAIEICPWGSKKFQTLKIDHELIKYMDQYVFDVIEKVNQKNIFPSKIKLVTCIGKDYYDIFNHNNSDFEKLSEFTKSTKTNNEIVAEPETLDENFVIKIKEKWPLNKNNVLTNRSFSFWKKNSIIYYNVYSTEGGANNPPGKNFHRIEKKLIQKYKQLIL